ncbi:hypothetical protein I3842_07G116700 [Carya illinoinensis]|uniref:Uncharacterized protein n=1 Tax=Carya illinoinensis TaxID=32201 RepID=A0A922EHY0_CARIL|nr:hypothetical protein I3842_07G116700 [Carya illinoinensis]
MQSRVAAKMQRWVLSLAHNQALRIGLSSSRSAGRTADPDIHSGEVEAGPDVYYRKNEGQGSVVDSDDAAKQELEHKAHKETGPLKPPRTPFASSPKLESTEVSPQPLDPVVQQKRSHATASVEDASCEGFDGTPWPKDKEKEHRDRNEQVEDDREYFKHHKASPLSEINVVDTRKPLTRATDGTADANEDNDRGADGIAWRPEQLDTAEEALRRAVEIFRQNAMRGDPETYPHSRVLRELRGEWF